MPQIPSSPSSPRRGMAIGIVLMIGLIVLVLGIAMIATSGNLLRSTVDAKERIRSRYAAETMVAIQMAVATEKAGNEFGSELKLPSITLTDLTTGPGEKAEAEMVSLAGSKAKPVQEVIPSGDYKGLRGLKIPFLIKSTGFAPGGAKTQVNAEIRMYQIPIFQFGVFYEGNLEITPGKPMIVGGPVHTNSNAYFRAYGEGISLAVQGPVTASEKIYTWRRATNGDLKFLLSPKDPTKYFVVPDLTTTLTLPTALPPKTDGHFNVTPNAPKMKLPIGTASAIELIMPRRSTDAQELARQKFDHKINCSSGCPNRFVNGVTARPSWITGPRLFYDRRERTWVKVWDFNIGDMATKIAPRQDSIFYLLDTVWTTYNAGGVNKSLLNAFRIVNAAKLPWNLTLASYNPIYIQGDFNSQPTIGCSDASASVIPPGGDYCNAMIAANTVTILSPIWPTLGTVGSGPLKYRDGSMERDSTTEWPSQLPSQAPSPPLPAPQTCANCPNNPYSGLTVRVNAAILTGNKPTPLSALPPLLAFVDDAAFEAKYEGGWHNTFRFLENLNGVPFVFRGSFVCLWDAKFPGLRSDPSEKVIGDYYSPPDREWGFDERFSNLNNMPPGTPYLVTSQFTGWSEPRW